jgi:hypothetical protein
MAVATACRLCTKNALKSIEVSNAIMQYVHGNQGGLHYPRGVPAETWGKRNQLKIERSGKLLEVFSDISFGAGSKHRSLQGLLVFFARGANWMAIIATGLRDPQHGRVRVGWLL